MMHDWEMSGPEEGDTVDLRVFISCADPEFDYDIIEITEGTTAQRKTIARKVAALLNKGGARMQVVSR